MENKQKMCEKLTELVREMTGTNSNPLKELRWVVDGNEEWIVPIFEDGTGEPNRFWPHGYYAVNVSGCSSYGAFLTVVENFIRRMW